jgi:hypothetical protein
MCENQERFRHANERLRDAVEDHVPETTTVPFLCECADDRCVDSVELTLGEYREIRELPELFIHCRGHTAAAHEEVVETTDRFELAEKGALTL